MHAKKIVDEALRSCLSSLHAKLAIAFKEAVCGVLQGGRLSLSQLARALEPTTTMRHRIKRIDRLLGNYSLYRARQEIYRQVAAQWLEGIEQILVVVDWSDATLDQKWHLLRASVAIEGRSMTLYEEVHPQRKLGNRLVHRVFLARLAKLLPVGCRPIVMTDAGFHSTWFELVTLRCWQWVGRIPGEGYGQYRRESMETMYDALPDSYFSCEGIRQCPVCPQTSDVMSSGARQTESQRPNSPQPPGQTITRPCVEQGSSSCARTVVAGQFSRTRTPSARIHRLSICAENADRAVFSRRQERAPRIGVERIALALRNAPRNSSDDRPLGRMADAADRIIWDRPRLFSTGPVGV